MTTPADAAAHRDAFVERRSMDAIGTFDVFSVYLDRHPGRHRPPLRGRGRLRQLRGAADRERLLALLPAASEERLR
jgi:hypothetical protein